MSVSQPRHTFHYLDPLLPVEAVSALDNFFLELDVATHMVEGKGKRVAARTGYHILRAVSIAVQAVAYAIFNAVKYSGKGLYYAALGFAKGVEALFITMPTAVQKRFFPTLADLHEKRVKTAKRALKEMIFSTAHIVGTAESKHSSSQQKALMHSLLIQPLRKLSNCKPEWKEYCALMGQIADGDLNAEELEENAQRVTTIAEGIPIRNISVLTAKFIEAFRSEREFESRLTSEEIKQDLSLLIRYPHLLMRQDAETLINSAPNDLRATLRRLKMVIQRRVLAQVHQKEVQLLEKFPSLLAKIDSNDLKKTCLSTEEEQFLNNRIHLLTQRIDQLKHSKKNHGFEFSLLTFELLYLEKQKEKLEMTNQSIQILTHNAQRVDEINQMHERCKESLCKTLETRIQKSLKKGLLNKEATSLQEAMTKLKEVESIDEKLLALHSMITQLHQLEMLIIKKGEGNSADLGIIQESVTEYNTLHKHITLAHEVEEWKAFTGLTTPDKRTEERQIALANDVLSLLLETKTECQILLLLAKQDTRSLLHKENASIKRKGTAPKIEESAKECVQAIKEKYLDEIKNRLVSISEFASHIQEGKEFEIINNNDLLKDKEAMEVLNFQQIGLNLQPMEHLSKWYARLQQVWIDHMPREQEEMLLVIFSSHTRKIKMAECFEQWFEMTTGKKLGVRLTFDHLTVVNHAAKRKEALRILKQRFQKESSGFPALLKKVRLKIEEKKRVNPLGKQVEGFDPTLIAKAKSPSQLTATRLPHDPIEGLDMDAEEVVDIIAGLERLRKNLSTDGTEIEKKTEWVITLDQYSKSLNCQHLRLMILAECREIIHSSFKNHTAVPAEIGEIFLQNHSIDVEGSHKINFEKMHNAERGDLLTHFLMFSFSAREEVEVSEEQSARLMQLCSLSVLSKKEIEEIRSLVNVVDRPSVEEFNISLMEISEQLQASPIGLEGVEAEIVRQSFKESTLPENSQTRTLLDSHMSRGTDALSFHLINYVYDQHKNNLHHHAGREAIARALIHTHSLYPKETRAYILEKIEENKRAYDVDLRTLASPLYIFYTDLLRQLDPKAYFTTGTIHTNVTHYNKQMLEVNEAHRLLMGCARAITDLSYSVKFQVEKGVLDTKLVHTLLHFKIAFQNLKKTYFEGKIEIVDFLKIESDLAEAAMVMVDPLMQAYLSHPDNETAIRNDLKTWVSANVTFTDQCVSRELRSIQGAPQFKSTEIPGFFTLGAGVVIDTLTGMIYNDGQQKVRLPAYLQNHPSTQSLGIHNFPYIWDPRAQGFVYHVRQEDGKSDPSLIVKNVEKKPVILKKLPLSFAGEEPRKAYLQFVPREAIQLPIASLHRMKIQQFWKGEESLFGYDQEGKLVAIFDDSSVKTAEGEYFFLTDDQKDRAQQIPPLSLLSKNFNLNELLVDQTLSTYYIPALELKLMKRSDTTGKETWICAFEGVPEKILEEPSKDSSFLSLRNSVDPQKMREAERGVEEAVYRRSLAARAQDPSLQEKRRLQQLDEAVIQQQNRYLTLVQPQFMTTCYDEAQRRSGIETLVAMLPNTVQDTFQDQLEEERSYYFYELFPLALQFLRELIDQKNEENSSQQEISPLLSAYLSIQKRYQSVCDKPLEAVFFDKSVDGSALTKDLTSSLTLAVNQLHGESPDPLFLMKDLSHYPLQGPMTSSQETLLNKALEKLKDSEDAGLPLKAYLLFVRHQHFLLKVRELAITPLSDKRDIVKDIKRAYNSSLHACMEMIRQLEIEEDLPKELLTLWRKSGIQPEHLLLVQAPPTKSKIEKTVNPGVTTELQVVSSKSFLERLSEKSVVEVRTKSPEKELSTHQEELSKAFKANSRSQVEGFYFEKMGYFSLRTLCEEFRLNERGEALYGLSKNDLEEMFAFLKEEKLITLAPRGLGYCLSSAESAGKGLAVNRLRARFASASVTQQDLEKIIERLQGFLFRAMQSGFEFSFIKGKESEIDKRLKLEKEVHLQKYLDAEHILKTELPKHHASLVDLKYAYLTGDYAKFLSATEDNHQEISRLSNALTRYLFHKTEVQHIENIQRAPAKGERNKIQLLQTKRNYSVDLLLQEDLKGGARREQIMQRAYLTFEEDYGNRCNMMQIRMFRSLMLSDKNIEGIDAIQARMGFGKTALLILLAVVRVATERTKPVKERHLVRYIVPRAVLEDNTSFFNKRLSSILGRNVVQDRDFTRYQIDRENPKTSFKLIIIDLQSRLHFYKETVNHGNMVIQPPEIRCSMEAQDADFAEMLRTQTFDQETGNLCLEAKRLLSEIRSTPTYTVFDELDDTQDFKSREVNFTRGAKIPIPTETIRPLEQVVSYIEQNKNKDWSDKKARAKEMVMALCTDREGNQIDGCPNKLIDYLSDHKQPINSETKALLSRTCVISLDDENPHQTENDSLFFLIRMLLLDDYILSLVRSKQPNTHYGIRFNIDPESGQRVYSYNPDTHSALLISVPYEGVNTPKGLSVFDNREVAALTTLRYYFSNETNFEIHPHLDFLITQMREDSLPSDLVAHYLPETEQREEHPAIANLRKMARILDAYELKKAKEAFYDTFMRAPTKEFRKFFAMAVVATQIRSDEGSAKSDRYEQGSPQDISLGCSGTVGDTSSYFISQAPDPAADGMLSLEIMGRDSNSTIEWLTPPQPEEDYLPAIIKTLLDNTEPNTRGIADIAGICKSRDGTPETVIGELWRQLKGRERFGGIEGIIYYGKDNVKRLYREGKEPILCTTEMEISALKEKKYFSFYKQKNCRGSDIKQAHHTHFLVTMDENVSNSDGKQTILRFRDIVTQDSGQSFSFAAMPEYEQIVRKEIKLPIDLPLQAKHIAQFLRIQEKNAEQENALTLFRKEMKAHIKVAAGHLEAELLSKLPKQLTQRQQQDYTAFLQQRNRLIPFIERSLNSLYAKYGLATKNMTRAAFVDQECKQALKALKALFAAAHYFANAYDIGISSKKKIYTRRIATSIEAFEKRFPEDKVVHISGTQSDGQNVAQAQAQAQAEAEAEACTETITETLLETQERMWTPHLSMAKLPREKISFDFLEKMELLSEIGQFPGLENTIRPSLRKDFSISPDLMKKQEVSHFALASTTTSRFIFISHEEAESFKREKENVYTLGENEFKRSPFSKFTLIDMRVPTFSVEATPDKTPLPVTKRTKQLTCVVLGDNKIPGNFHTLETKDLRSLSLDNVKPRQLLPKLTVTHSDQNLKGFIVPQHFGVSQEINCTLSLNPVPVDKQLTLVVSVRTDSSKVELPLDNEVLNKVMKEVFEDPSAQKKIQTVHDKIEEEYSKILPQLEELKKKQKELEQLTKKNQELIANVGNFELNNRMKEGLLQRDSDYKNALSHIGKDAIRMCREIKNLQSSIKRELSMKKLNKLKEKFDAFVSPNILAQAAHEDFDYNKSLLFSKNEWNDMREDWECASMLERIYGRIVHEVHSSSVYSAKTCPRDDCKHTFASVIPDLLEIMPKLYTAIEEIEKNEKEREKIELEIQKFMKRAKPLLDALECAKKLVKSEKEIVEMLDMNGLHYSAGEFFNQFQFNELSQAPRTPATITLGSVLPEYRFNIQKDMKSYKSTFKGLSNGEKVNYRKNQNFLKHVFGESKKIVNRETEVHVL